MTCSNKNFIDFVETSIAHNDILFWFLQIHIIFFKNHELHISILIEKFSYKFHKFFFIFDIDHLSILILSSQMSLLSILAFTLLSISSTHSFNYQRIANDDICDVKFGILCLHDELLIVKTVAEGIIRRANDIEKNVRKRKSTE